MSASDDEPIAAAILAGGRARLGGANNVALRVGGARILDRQLDVLRQLTDSIFIVTADAARYAAAGLRVVPDIVDGAGAPGGVYTAIRVEEIGPEALATYDPDGLLFVNVNTPHDYERARSLIELGSKPIQDRITDEPGQ
jgi:molybdopterin-guanine dinucleotide biosynthesis protein A